MAVTAVLYSLWYEDLTTGLKLTVGRPADNKPNEKKIFRLIVAKALPLSAIALLSTLVFIPDAIAILSHSMQGWLGRVLMPKTYSAVNTAFCLVVFINFFLTVYISYITKELIGLWIKLRKR
jgi:hypothetical protein